MALILSEELQSIQISEGIVHLGECNSCITLRLKPLSANYLMAKTDCQNLSQFCASKLILIMNDFVIFPVLRSMRELITGQQRN